MKLINSASLLAKQTYISCGNINRYRPFGEKFGSMHQNTNLYHLGQEFLLRLYPPQRLTEEGSHVW